MATYPRPEVHIAPMLDVSTREFRMLHRLLSEKSILWTEMFVDQVCSLLSAVYPQWSALCSLLYECCPILPALYFIAGFYTLSNMFVDQL